MDPVLQRAMFQQQQQQQQAMTEADNVKSAQGLQAVAQQMQNVNTEIDNAEDVAGIMNAIRGDNATVEQRRMELAKEVGDADAKATPESVLVMLQPTFEMMESLTGQSTDMPMGDVPVETPVAEGTGITSGLMPMPDGGKKKDNFRSEEAIARINAGEMPVKAADGMPINSFNVNQNRLNQMFGLDNFNLNPELLAANIGGNPLIGDTDKPVNTLENQDFIDKQIELQRKRLQPIVDLYAPDPNKTTEDIMAERLFSMQPYLTKKYTPQQNLTQLKALYGDTDLGVPANLAVAKFGANIAKGTGSLPDAAFGALPGLTTDLSALALAKRKSDRDLIAQASTLSTKQGTARDTQVFDIAKEAMKRSDAVGDKYQDVMKSVIENAAKNGIELSKFDIRNLVESEFKVLDTLGKTIRGQKNYGLYKDGKLIDVKRVFETSNLERPRLFKENGEYKDLPDTYVEIGNAQLENWANSSAGTPFDISKAKSETVSYYDDRDGVKRYVDTKIFYTPQGEFILDRKNNKYVKPESVTKDLRFGSFNQNFKTSVNKQTGDIIVTDNLRPQKGLPATFILKTFVDYENGERYEVDVGKNTYKNEMPEYGSEERLIKQGAFANQVIGSQRVLLNAGEGGDPLNELGVQYGQIYQSLPKNIQQYEKKQALLLTKSIAAMDRVLNKGLSADLYGVQSGLKRLSNNIIAPFTELGKRSEDIFGEYLKTDEAKLEFKLIEREFVAANLLGEKNPVTEQQIYRDIFPDGKTFATNKRALTELLTIRKIFENRLNQSLGIITNTRPVVKKDMPLGLNRETSIPLEDPDFRLKLSLMQKNNENLKGLYVSTPTDALKNALTRERDEYIKQSQVQGISNDKKEDLENKADKLNGFIKGLKFKGKRMQYQIGDYGLGDI